MQTPLNFAAAVLAGGQSSRMGTDKAFLPWHGTRLLDHQVATLRELQPAELLISGRPHVNYGVPDARVVLDSIEGCGPLGGITAILAAIRASHVIILAIDLPQMSSRFLRRLRAQACLGLGVVARNEFAWEPLAVIYPRELLPLAEARLARRELALQPLIDEAVSAGWMRAIPASAADIPLFTNLNFRSDLPA